MLHLKVCGMVSWQSNHCRGTFPPGKVRLTCSWGMNHKISHMWIQSFNVPWVLSKYLCLSSSTPLWDRSVIFSRVVRNYTSGTASGREVSLFMSLMPCTSWIHQWPLIVSTSLFVWLTPINTHVHEIFKRYRIVEAHGSKHSRHLFLAY